MSGQKRGRKRKFPPNYIVPYSLGSDDDDEVADFSEALEQRDSHQRQEAIQVDRGDHGHHEAQEEHGVGAARADANVRRQEVAVDIERIPNDHHGRDPQGVQAVHSPDLLDAAASPDWEINNAPASPVLAPNADDHVHEDNVHGDRPGPPEGDELDDDASEVEQDPSKRIVYISFFLFFTNIDL